MSDPEQGIAQAQIEAARRQGSDGLAQVQRRSIAYLNERIILMVGALGFIGLCVVWATAKSPWLLYGSLVMVILFALLWGYARIQRLEQLRIERAREAENWTRDQDRG